MLGRQVICPSESVFYIEDFWILLMNTPYWYVACLRFAGVNKSALFSSTKEVEKYVEDMKSTLSGYRQGS